MPLGRESRHSRNSGKVVQRHSMPASMAAGGMSSARWRLRTTRCLFSLAQGASVKPQLPITTEVMPCQQDEVPSGSQKICASMCVWPSTKPGVTTWPSASTTSRARSRIRPIVTMRPCRTPTSARYRGVAGLVHEDALELELRVAGLAPVIQAAPPSHPRRILEVAVDHPARAVVVRDGLAALFPTVDEDVNVGLGIVADRRALFVRHRLAQMLLQQLGVAEQLLQVVADLGEPRRNAFRLDGRPRVGEGLVERVPGVHGRSPFSQPWMIAGRGRAERPRLEHTWRS